MSKRLTNKTTIRVKDRISILLIITNSADDELGELRYGLTLYIYEEFLCIEDTLERWRELV